MVFHFTCAPYGGESLIKSNFSKSILEYGAQGVELFYIISGFVITYALSRQNYNIKNYPIFLLKRISRIVPPYLLTIFGILFANFLLSRFIWYSEFALNWKEILINIFYLADLFPRVNWINPIFATLKVEFQFYILIGILFPFINKSKWILAAVVFLFFGAGIYWGEHDTVFRNAPFFFGGVTTFYISQKSNLTANLILLLSNLVVLLYFYPLQDSIVLILGVSLLYFLPSKFSLLKRSGEISYSLYLTHGVFGGWFIYFATQIEMINNYPLLIIGFAFVISWIFAWIMYQIIEKPSIKLSKSFKYKST
jgi:exopolysaccharide production protein ExoZ